MTDIEYFREAVKSLPKAQSQELIEDWIRLGQITCDEYSQLVELINA